MRFIVSILTLTAVLAALTSRRRTMMNGADAAPAEGLTPFGFLMARAYGEPAEHPVMRLIAFKPSDGAKFRETFEKRHGPRGRDLIDSLGSGSYRTDQKSKTAIAGTSTDGKSAAAAKNPVKPHRSPKQRSQ